MEAVWPDSIVEENNLAQAIWKLRQVFGETPGSHSYIVTVPGRGYRFVAEVNKRNGNIVSRGPADSTTTPTSVQGPTEADPTADRHRLLRKARHGTSPSNWRIFGAAIAAIIVVGLAALFFVRYRSLPASVRAPSSPAPADAVLSVPARIAEKSIAVLPFENRSDEKENAYFADGIEDEILTRLSNIADLKVISRTSTRQYQSKPANLREIAKQLGVANILEGSVQKVADQVRVNVQLVNAQTDSHLWANTYDRKLTDIFGVESEIAKGIAESLQAKLTSHEEQIAFLAAAGDLGYGGGPARALLDGAVAWLLSQRLPPGAGASFAARVGPGAAVRGRLVRRGAMATQAWPRDSFGLGAGRASAPGRSKRLRSPSRGEPAARGVRRCRCGLLPRLRAGKLAHIFNRLYQASRRPGAPRGGRSLASAHVLEDDSPGGSARPASRRCGGHRPGAACRGHAIEPCWDRLFLLS